MYKEVVIGFDCREMWLPNFVSWSDERKQELLSSEIERHLTIDRTQWNSVFVTHTTRINGEWVGTAPSCRLEIPMEDRTSEGFWQDLEIMLDFLKRNNAEYQKLSWVIALTVVESPKYVERLQAYLDDYTKGHHVPVPTQPEVSVEWMFLGYDVQDSGPTFWEGLGGGAYPDEIQLPLKEKWGKYLNKYHLFTDQELALEYCDWQEAKEDHPYFVYGLYLIQPFPEEGSTA